MLVKGATGALEYPQSGMNILIGHYINSEQHKPVELHFAKIIQLLNGKANRDYTNQWENGMTFTAALHVWRWYLGKYYRSVIS